MRAVVEPAPTQAVLIRQASADDRAGLVEMYEGFQPRPASLGLPPRAGIDQWLERLGAALNFVAVADDKLVGHAILCPEDGCAEVAVFVRQEHRVRGIARRLMEEVIAQARRMGIGYLWGMTELDNVPMLRLAHAVGFVQDEKDRCRFGMELTRNTKI